MVLIKGAALLREPLFFLNTLSATGKKAYPEPVIDHITDLKNYITVKIKDEEEKEIPLMYCTFNIKAEPSSVPGLKKEQRKTKQTVTQNRKGQKDVDPPPSLTRMYSS